MAAMREANSSKPSATTNAKSTPKARLTNAALSTPPVFFSPIICPTLAVVAKETAIGIAKKISDAWKEIFLLDQPFMALFGRARKDGTWLRVHDKLYHWARVAIRPWRLRGAQSLVRGGYLEHRRNTPMGIQVLWQGWLKLHDKSEGWRRS